MWGDRCLHCSRHAVRGLLCDLHDHRLRDGRPMDAPVRHHRGAPLKGYVSYPDAHCRIKRLWGKASGYSCVKCGDVAQEWGYDHSDPSELLGKNRRGQDVTYSVWPEFYMPLCRKCHAALDHPGNVGVDEKW